MKKNIITIITIIILIATLIAVTGIVINSISRTNAYTRSAEGTIIEVTDEVVAVETADGHVWEFKGEGFEVGQTVNVVFSNNGSPDCVKDDMIKWVG
jgi:hypothetical protein